MPVPAVAALTASRYRVTARAVLTVARVDASGAELSPGTGHVAAVAHPAQHAGAGSGDRVAFRAVVTLAELGAVETVFSFITSWKTNNTRRVQLRKRSQKCRINRHLCLGAELTFLALFSGESRQTLALPSHVVTGRVVRACARLRAVQAERALEAGLGAGGPDVARETRARSRHDVARRPVLAGTLLATLGTVLSFLAPAGTGTPPVAGLARAEPRHVITDAVLAASADP